MITALCTSLDKRMDRADGLVCAEKVRRHLGGRDGRLNDSPSGQKHIRRMKADERKGFF